MKSAAALALFALAAESALASGQADGSWCSAGGELLSIEGDRVGFNEHTVCKWGEQAPQDAVFDATAVCANVHADGNGGWVRVGETTARLVTSRENPDVITVTVEGGQPDDFARCDR